MDKYTVFPDGIIKKTGIISSHFFHMGIKRFKNACEFVHRLPYGYNSDREDLLILFKEMMGTCTTKHAVIATLAKELNLPVYKNIGIYKMTEEIVSGTHLILKRYNLLFVPMIHCYLAFKEYRVDLTEGNHNGKNTSIEEFIYSEKVEPNITAKKEYLVFRKTLSEKVLGLKGMEGVQVNTLLHARQEGLELLKSNV